MILAHDPKLGTCVFAERLGLGVTFVVCKASVRQYNAAEHMTTFLLLQNWNDIEAVQSWPS